MTSHYKAKKILDVRKSKGRIEYLIDWDYSWVSEDDLIGCHELIAELLKKKAALGQGQSAGGVLGGQPGTSTQGQSSGGHTALTETPKRKVGRPRKGQELKQRAKELVKEILVPKKQVKVAAPASAVTTESPEEVNESPEVSRRVPEDVYSGVQPKEFMAGLDLIATGQLERSPIYYLKNKFGRNFISHSAYAPGVDMKEAIVEPKKSTEVEQMSGAVKMETSDEAKYEILDETVEKAVEEELKKINLLPWQIESPADKDWRDVVKEQDLSSPLSQKVLKHLP